VCGEKERHAMSPDSVPAGHDNPRLTLSALVGEVERQMAVLAELQQRRAQLVAAAQAAEGRVTVTVNADGVTIDTRFSAYVDELTYDDIAVAVTEATQAAIARVKQKADDLVQPFLGMRERLPTLSDIVAGMPDLRAHIPMPPRASLTPPGDQHLSDVPAELSDAEVRENNSDVHAVTETKW
jgi:hypothetical protein